MISVRKMEPSEADRVKKVAKKAFSIVESMFIGHPKEAMVAEIDHKIVGGILIRYIVSGGKKIGYFDAAFVDPTYHGQGVGSMLYKETTKYLWDQGCDALSAMVKDDNVGSWKLLLNNDFSLTTLSEGFRQLGFLPMLMQYFTTPCFISNGMEFYLANKDQTIRPKKVNTTQQIGLYLLINFLLILFALVGGGPNFKMFFSAYATLLAGGVIFGYIGTLFSNYKWKFRLNSCGGVIVALVNMVAVFPLIGNWYPTKYENTDAFKKAMGLSALCEWLFMLCITIAASTLQSQYILFKYLFQLGSAFLMFRIIAIYPFESFGGRRVYHWNKWLYSILGILSILAIILLK